MPEISRFYGIIITMYYDDHNPPHFHARYGEGQSGNCHLIATHIRRETTGPRTEVDREVGVSTSDRIGLDNWNACTEPTTPPMKIPPLQ